MTERGWVSAYVVNYGWWSHGIYRHGGAARLIVSRRTSMLVDHGTGRYRSNLVKELCELTLWAPNHKRTWPWRFHDGRQEMAEGRAR